MSTYIEDDTPPAGPLGPGLLELLAELVDVTKFAAGDYRGSASLRQRANGKTTPVNAKADQPQLLSRADPYRRGCTVYNDSAGTLYIKLGRQAAVDDWSVKLAAGDYYETPTGYRGEITGIWSAANGQARVTEFE